MTATDRVYTLKACVTAFRSAPDPNAALVQGTPEVHEITPGGTDPPGVSNGSWYIPFYTTSTHAHVVYDIAGTGTAPTAPIGVTYTLHLLSAIAMETVTDWTTRLETLLNSMAVTDIQQPISRAVNVLTMTNAITSNMDVTDIAAFITGDGLLNGLTVATPTQNVNYNINEGAGYVLTATFKNNGGTVSQIIGDNKTEYEEFTETQAWDVNTTLSGTDIGINVTGNVLTINDKSITWKIKTTVLESN
jgi:hypothetical protein